MPNSPQNSQRCNGDLGGLVALERKCSRSGSMATTFTLLHVFNVMSVSEILTPQSLAARRGRRNTKLNPGEWAMRDKLISIYGRATMHSD